MLALLAAILPSIHLVFILRARRARQQRLVGVCPTGLYDLRAHSPGQKCPECGTPIILTPSAH